MSKEERKLQRHISPFPFPPKELPDCGLASLTFETESRKIIIFADSNQAIRPQHTMHPASSMRQVAVARRLARPTVN